MKKHKQIYYIPGMISLILLPILCYPYLKPLNKEERCLDICLMQKTQNYIFDSNNIPFDNRKFLTIHLDGPKKENIIKLEHFRTLILDIYKNKDTINSLHLVFGDHSDYDTFVESINICLKEGIVYFAIFENNLYVVYKNSSIDVQREKVRDMIHYAVEEYSDNYFNQLREKNKTLNERFLPYKKFWPLFILFLILVYLSLLWIRKINYKP